MINILDMWCNIQYFYTMTRFDTDWLIADFITEKSKKSPILKIFQIRFLGISSEQFLKVAKDQIQYHILYCMLMIY